MDFVVVCSSRNGVRLQHVSIEVGRTLAWVQHKECRI